jgi:hypothetical protein
MAPIHDNLFRDLTSEDYAERPYVDPRLGVARCRILVGINVPDESDIKNSLLWILLASSAQRRPGILDDKEVRTIWIHFSICYLMSGG